MGYGGSDFCPIPFFKENLDWALEDPKGKPLEKVREIRDEIERRVRVNFSRKIRAFMKAWFFSWCSSVFATLIVN